MPSAGAKVLDLVAPGVVKRMPETGLARSASLRSGTLVVKPLPRHVCSSLRRGRARPERPRQREQLLAAALVTVLCSPRFQRARRQLLLMRGPLMQHDRLALRLHGAIESGTPARCRLYRPGLHVLHRLLGTVLSRPTDTLPCSVETGTRHVQPLIQASDPLARTRRLVRHWRRHSACMIVRGLGADAGLAAPRIELRLALIGPGLAQVLLSVSLVRQALPFVGDALALVGDLLPFAGEPLALGCGQVMRVAETSPAVNLAALRGSLPARAAHPSTMCPPP